jgi:hypothetical protein
MDPEKIEKLYDINTPKGLDLFDLDLFDLDLDKITISLFKDKLIYKLKDITTDFNYTPSHKFPKEIKDCLCILLNYLKDENGKVTYIDEFIEIFINIINSILKGKFSLRRGQIIQWIKNQRRKSKRIKIK